MDRRKRSSVSSSTMPRCAASSPSTSRPQFATTSPDSPSGSRRRATSSGCPLNSCTWRSSSRGMCRTPPWTRCARSLAQSLCQSSRCRCRASATSRNAANRASCGPRSAVTSSPWPRCRTSSRNRPNDSACRARSAVSCRTWRWAGCAARSVRSRWSTSWRASVQRSSRSRSRPRDSCSTAAAASGRPDPHVAAAATQPRVV